MNRHYLYQKTAGGTCVCIKPDQLDQFDGRDIAGITSQLLGVVPGEPGVFEVKASGDIPPAGSFLLLPVKGGQQISLLMEVHEVAPLITPEHSWSARCSGLKQSEFQLRTLDAQCDLCGYEQRIEFLQLSSDVQQDAIVGLNSSGWQADEARQVCPKCKGDRHER